MQAQCSWQEGDAQGGLKAQLQALLAALEAQQARQDGAGAPSTSTTAAAAGSAFFPAPSCAGTSSSVAARQEARRAEQLGVIVGLPGCEDVRSLLAGLEAADKLRLAGNAAVKAGKAAEAVAKYSEALQGELRELWDVLVWWCWLAERRPHRRAAIAPRVARPCRTTRPLPAGSSQPAFGCLSICSQRVVPSHHGGAAVQPRRRTPAPQAERAGGWASVEAGVLLHCRRVMTRVLAA